MVLIIFLEQLMMSSVLHEYESICTVLMLRRPSLPVYSLMQMETIYLPIFLQETILLSSFHQVDILSPLRMLLVMQRMLLVLVVKVIMIVMLIVSLIVRV